MLARLERANLLIVDEIAGQPWRIAPALDAALLLETTIRARPAASALPALWALATGAPIIAERIDGLRDLLEHDATAALFETGDVNAGAEQVCRLVDDRALSKRLAENGRQLAVDDFSIEAYRERLRHAYELRLANRAIRTTGKTLPAQFESAAIGEG
jgi:glycosyltransferase involved in cell wall biosynthesis